MRSPEPIAKGSHIREPSPLSCPYQAIYAPKPVYAFIRYEGMNRGATWTYGWYREGEYLDGNTCLWWIRLPDCPYMVGENGFTFLYYRRPGGYDPGTYEVRIWIEDRFQGAYRFVIVPAP
ncbi:MAG: hypothetical protein H5T61_06220 [Thermoflexales bacterium]|nr:hypothetical protein [Thermoflexales bacterium]